MKRDQRGFGIYTDLHDERGCRVRVKQSSAIGRRRAWLFVGGGSSNAGIVDTRGGDPTCGAHLSPREARRIAKALLRWVDEDAKD